MEINTAYKRMIFCKPEWKIFKDTLRKQMSFSIRIKKALVNKASSFDDPPQQR